eukprot:jgi/Galph1/3524/GphlegSOOS_G2217.1
MPIKVLLSSYSIQLTRASNKLEFGLEDFKSEFGSSISGLGLVGRLRDGFVMSEDNQKRTSVYVDFSNETQVNVTGNNGEAPLENLEIAATVEALGSKTTRIQHRSSLQPGLTSLRSSLGTTRISLRTAEEVEQNRPSVSFDFRNSFREKVGVLTTLVRTVQMIGLCYGDLGTSPLYTVASLVGAAKAPSLEEIYSAGSMVFWLLFLVSGIKYASLVSFADHNGEGGAFAMVGFLKHKLDSSKLFTIAIFVATIGAGALLADGVLTPAITVVSAMQGIQVGAPSFTTPAVIGVSIAILVLIFLGQQLGSSRIGISYGPILIVFFICQGIAGIYNITKHPAIFKALNPYYALKGIGYHWNDGKIGYLKIADALLCTTGSEGMYADMGHFGKTPMRLGFFLAVFPSVWMSYFGQLALVAHNPEVAVTAGDKLYFYQVSSSLLWPLVVITTLASIIASQAIISGSFSIISQAMRQNIFPRLHVKHTDARIFGQVFCPEVNLVMAVLTLAVTGGFQTSGALTAAYGVAVTTSFITTSILFTIIISRAWKLKLIFWIWYPLLFGTLDLLLWTSALTKVPTGGYVPIVIAVCCVSLMLLWKWGADKEAKYYREHSLKWSEYKQMIESSSSKLTTLEGCFIFPTRMQTGIPYSYSIFLRKLHLHPELSIFVTVRYPVIPFVDEERRFYVFKYSDQIYRVLVNVGYAEGIGSLDDFLELSSILKNRINSCNSEIVFVKSRVEILAKREHKLPYRVITSAFGLLKKLCVRIDTELGLPPESVDLGTLVWF